MVHVLLKPGLDNFEYFFTSVWNEFNRAVIWVLFGIAYYIALAYYNPSYFIDLIIKLSFLFLILVIRVYFS